MPKPTAATLAAHGEHFWTVAIDLVGHGWSDKPAIGYEIPDYGRHLLAVIRALGRESAHVSGESLGRLGRGVAGDPPPRGGGPAGAEHRRRLDRASAG